MDLATFIGEFEGALFEFPKGTMTPDTEFKQLEQWESVAVLNVIGLIDIEFGIQISIDDLNRCKTVQDLYQLAQEKKA